MTCRVRGSGHIIAMARSVIGLSVVQDGPEPDRNGPRRLEVVKTNLCRYPKALGVRFEEGPSCHELHELHEEGEGGGASVGSGSHSVPFVRYGEAPHAYKEPTQAEACAEWLLELLEEAEEPMRPKEVLALGKEAGFKEGVIYRARKELEGTVVNTEGKRAPNNRWALAEG